MYEMANTTSLGSLECDLTAGIQQFGQDNLRGFPHPRASSWQWQANSGIKRHKFLVLFKHLASLIVYNNFGF